jgi:hypothetical protein
LSAGEANYKTDFVLKKKKKKKISLSLSHPGVALGVRARHGGVVGLELDARGHGPRVHVGHGVGRGPGLDRHGRVRQLGGARIVAAAASERDCVEKKKKEKN